MASYNIHDPENASSQISDSDYYAIKLILWIFNNWISPEMQQRLNSVIGLIEGEIPCRISRVNVHPSTAR